MGRKTFSKSSNIFVYGSTAYREQLRAMGQWISKPPRLDPITPGQFYDTHIPYAKLTGTDAYSIGFQHGMVAKTRIDRAIEVYAKLYEDARGVHWNVARARAEKFIPMLERDHVEILEELRGIAEGSGRDLIDILALNVRSEIAMVEISDGCTSLGQKQKMSGDVYVGQNWDWMPEADEFMIWLDVVQEGKPRLLYLAEAGIIGKWGFNSSGLAIMLNAISANEVDYNRLPVHFILRKALEQESVEAAVDLIEKERCASCCNFLMGDPTRWCSVEITPKGIAILPPDKHTGVASHTNHIVDSVLHAKVPSNKASLSSTQRYSRLLDINKETDASFESFRVRLSDRENGDESICRYPIPGAVGLNRSCTLYTIIVDTNKLEGNFSIGPPADDPTQYKLFFAD
ncbi:CYFA0S09e02498g1_1 [Cyberlindnera fabianii]|uniref:CYFA0S09e02498g1_1 n=1 Tax=Cyberlindnera fabianii TaxID=36022 RepID=A0A061AXU1_CYBFA|nr:CYFA0S09e02498g1_1 [Cyberlindnera fabianii]